MVKKLIFIFPIFLGLVVGGFTNPFGAGKKNAQIPSPAVSPETSVPKQIPHSISHYLISSQTLFSKAIELSQNEDTTNAQVIALVNEAISQATQAIQNYPADSRGWAQRARVYQNLEKYLPDADKIAIGDYTRAATLDPQNSSYYASLSQLWLKSGDLKKAVVYLDQAAQADPTDAQVWFDLAKLQTQAGLLASAQKNYQKVLPLLADQEQKQVVQKELAAIQGLLAQNKGNEPLIDLTSKTDDIELPDSPPQLEAGVISGRVIIASPDDSSKFKVQSSKLESNAFSGNAILPVNEKTITIENSNITDLTQIYLAATGNTENQVLSVRSKDAGKFTVAITLPLSHDLEFKWWIIN